MDPYIGQLIGLFFNLVKYSTAGVLNICFLYTLFFPALKIKTKKYPRKPTTKIVWLTGVFVSHFTFIAIPYNCI